MEWLERLNQAINYIEENLDGTINKVSLKAFPRISFKISIKGDVEINYRIEKKEAFRIVGVKEHLL